MVEIHEKEAALFETTVKRFNEIGFASSSARKKTKSKNALYH